MIVAGNVLEGLAIVIKLVLNLYFYVIVARALISWVNPDPYNPIVQFLYRATEPVLDPIRRRLDLGVGIDLSPLIVIVIIYFLEYAVVQSLLDIARQVH